jgi:hypothetical protein
MESYLTRTKEKDTGRREWLMLYITFWILISLGTIPLAYRYCRNYLHTHHNNQAISCGEGPRARPDRTDNLISMKTLVLGFVGVMSFLVAIFYESIAYQRNIWDSFQTLRFRDLIKYIIDETCIKIWLLETKNFYILNR